MTTVKPQILGLNGGEVDSEVMARSEIDSYANKAAVYENALPALKGGLVRAPGSRHIGFTYAGPGQDGAEDLDARLLTWRFSRTQSFTVELCPGRLRLVHGVGYLQGGGAKASFAASWTDASTGGATVTEGDPTWPTTPSDPGYAPPPSGAGGGSGGGGGVGGGGGGWRWWQDYDELVNA